MKKKQEKQSPHLLPGDRRDIVYFRNECDMTFEQIANRLCVTAPEVRIVYKEEKKNDYNY